MRVPYVLEVSIAVWQSMLLRDVLRLRVLQSWPYVLCRLCSITTKLCGRPSQGWDAMQVRVWRIGESQDLVASMKGHKAAVTGLRLTRGDAEVVSAGADGCCIVWDLHTFVRRTSLVGQLFSGVAYHPDESQLVTVGACRDQLCHLHFCLANIELGHALGVLDRQATHTGQHVHAGFLSQHGLRKAAILRNMSDGCTHRDSFPRKGVPLGRQVGSS